MIINKPTKDGYYWIKGLRTDFNEPVIGWVFVDYYDEDVWNCNITYMHYEDDIFEDDWINKKLEFSNKIESPFN